jgi:magnesium chelatase family protein
MFSSLSGAQAIGIDAAIVYVEVDISRGLHSFSIVGLPDKAVEESRDRVNAAIKNTGFKGPKQGNQKTTVSLAPADIKKEGPTFDLPIALSFLLASKQIRFDGKKKMFLGELSINGKLRKIKGILPIVQKAKVSGYKEFFVPKENAAEAALIDGIEVYGAETLKEVIEHNNTQNREEDGTPVTPKKITLQPKTKIEKDSSIPRIDFSEIKGQQNAKRAMSIAAAGGHNIVLYGPPGTGKTMLARCFSDILPALSFDEMLEVTSIHSVSGLLEKSLIEQPPFRSPHHSASFVSLVGGGNTLRPGEITLAHRGVLFLDEFPEFERRTIEALRQPIEDAKVNITRARGSVTYPANFILVAAMNPCPCGNFGSESKKRCICTPADLIRYKKKISGPIMDRIDIWISVDKVDPKRLAEKETIKESPKIQKSVGRVRRGYYRSIKTARPSADLENSENIQSEHILEALQYRPRDIV